MLENAFLLESGLNLLFRGILFSIRISGLSVLLLNNSFPSTTFQLIIESASDQSILDRAAAVRQV